MQKYALNPFYILTFDAEIKKQISEFFASDKYWHGPIAYKTTIKDHEINVNLILFTSFFHTEKAVLMLGTIDNAEVSHLFLKRDYDLVEKHSYRQHRFLMNPNVCEYIIETLLTREAMHMDQPEFDNTLLSIDFYPCETLNSNIGQESVVIKFNYNNGTSEYFTICKNDLSLISLEELNRKI